jgi:uncharacterized protein
MSDLKIPVDRLTDRGERFCFEASASWWAAREGPREPGAELEAEEIETPFRFELEVRRRGDDLLIEGTMAARVRLRCSRCGKRYSHPLREAYRLVLEPDDGQAGVDPEGERALAEKGLCLGEDLEGGYYRGPLLWLDDFFGEVVALAMPIQPLCDESCPGICPRCGAERVAIEGETGETDATEGAAGAFAARPSCDCEDEKIESPFAVLAKLKGGSEGNG